MKTIEKLILFEKKEQAIRRIQTVALRAIHEFFFEEGYEQLMPIILSPITDPLGPDPGSSVIKTGEIEYLGQKLQLTQSMILHKQVALGMGLDRIYIVSPNVRLESPKRRDSGIHAFEFSQVDFEIRGAEMEDVFKLMEALLRRVLKDVQKLASEELEVLGREFTAWDARFPRYTTHELMEKYGKDWEIRASAEECTPFWVLCHKREFYDKLDREDRGHCGLDGEHYLNYDLVYPEGFLEALSGAEREFEYEHIKTRIERDDFKLESYRPYVERAKESKLYKSAGGGFGVERLIRFLTGTEHISEVQVFKRIPGIEVEL